MSYDTGNARSFDAEGIMDATEIAAPFERDPRFPTGPWTGFFQQALAPGRNATDLDLFFRDGEVSGQGRDWVGSFTVRGHYDLADGRCQWTKKYRGKHAVTYIGYSQGPGIWGVWEIRALFGLLRDKGGFHLWPAGTEPGDEADRTYEAARAALGLPLEQPGGSVRPVLAPFLMAAAIVLLCLKCFPILHRLLG